MRLYFTKITFFTFCLFIGIHLSANEYYVSPAGSDSNTGSDINDAFRTIQHAVDEALDGDIVWVADGTYTENVIMTVSGVEDYWITLKAINKHQAKIRSTSSNCIAVEANYIIIDGFDLQTTGTYGSGVAANQGHHHIAIQNCYAHDCGQSGFQIWDCDFISIENNICTRNGWLMPYAGSGISVYGGFNSDNTEGLHNIVRNNICFNNDNGPETAMTDGNGIIIDDLKCTQTGHDFTICSLDGYNNVETLVEGNLCFDNGGRGIQVYLTENVTVRNNTCYLNSKRDSEGTWRGEIGVSNSDNLRMVNNIAVCNTDMGFSLSASNSAFLIAQYGSHSTKNITFNNNLSFNISKPTDKAFHNLVGASAVKQANNLFSTDPLFVNASIDSTSANFMLQEGSPAIDAGTMEYGKASTDLAGNARAMRTAIDLGCYEALGETLQTGFHLLNKENQLNIYPNPSLDFLNIQLTTDKLVSFSVTVFSLDGKTELQPIISTTLMERLDIRSLQPGMYILEVVLNHSQKLSKTFQKF
ncbi:MAG: choice-of-anchor Q domain-containing protein [Prolixibacteraceae bacterium]